MWRCLLWHGYVPINLWRTKLLLPNLCIQQARPGTTGLQPQLLWRPREEDHKVRFAWATKWIQSHPRQLSETLLQDKKVARGQISEIGHLPGDVWGLGFSSFQTSMSHASVYPTLPSHSAPIHPLSMERPITPLSLHEPRFLSSLPCY